MPKKAETPITIWKCAIIKYVSCKWISSVELPRKMPVNPPEINRLTKPMANIMPEEQKQVLEQDGASALIGQRFIRGGDEYIRKVKTGSCMTIEQQQDEA